jgi:hypothetical protein
MDLRSAPSLGHHPQLYATSRYGCWCICDCGWRSGRYVATVGAHMAFGRHLIDERNRRRA